MVVRAESGGRSYALKGYLRPRPQRADLYAALDRYPSSLRYPVRYLPGEIYLYVTDRGAWYDLLAADWAEGHTLDYAIRRALHYRSSADLTALSRAFEAMAAELLAQPWAHGDLKPSNIMVTPSGTLRLIDYDGAFVPERAAETAADPAPAAPCSSECLPFVPERIADGWSPCCMHSGPRNPLCQPWPICSAPPPKTDNTRDSMYTTRIDEEHRAAILLLCDRSGSMAEETRLDGMTMTRAEAVACLINQLLDELLGRMRRADRVRDCLDIALLEYAGDGVVPLLSPDGGFVPVAELLRRPVEVRPRHVLRRLPSGNQVAATIPQRQWIDAKASGNTPMRAAFDEAERLARRNSFPPIVINITDGEASDADDEELLAAAERLRALSTGDGNLLLFNIHLASETDDPADSLRFPSETDRLPDRPHARLLYALSSTLPSCYDEAIRTERPEGRPPFRAVSYNCPINTLFAVLTVGTTAAIL